MSSWLRRPGVRGFLYLVGGNALITISQGLQFFLLARGLGPTQFGCIAATGAVTALLVPFSGMGSANVMIMRSTRDPEVLPLYYGNALAIMAVTGSVLVLVAAGFVPWFKDQIPVTLMVVYGTSEIVASKLVDICWHAFIAKDQPRQATRFYIVQSAGRVVFAILFLSFSARRTAMRWAWCALFSNLLVSCWAVARTLRVIGRPRLDLSLARREFGIGASFAVGISAKGFYTDADKVFLAHYLGPEIVGQYTMAFRVIQIAMVPIRALSYALQARLFRAGAAGVARTLEVTLKVLGPITIFTAAFGFLSFLAAPLLTFVAGPRYGMSVTVLRTLCFLPIFLGIQSLLNDTLATSGSQRLAAGSQVFCASVICLLCVFLIPRLGWKGAALASYGSQLTLCTLMSLAVWYKRGPTDLRANV